MQGYRTRGPAEGHAIDEWSTVTASRMMVDGYCPSAIINYLEAYGLSFFTACALVRELQAKQTKH